MPQAAGACGGGRGYGEGAGARWSRSVGRGHDQLRFSLADALAREEPGVRLEGIAELAERAVQLGRARVHLEDREDAPVALDEGDVERGGDGLHVELGEDLLAEVEEDQVPLDLFGRRALEAARLPLAAVGQLHPESQRTGARLDGDHAERHAREGVAPARALGVRGRLGRRTLSDGGRRERGQAEGRRQQGDSGPDHGWTSRVDGGSRRRARLAAAKSRSATSTTAPPAASRSYYAAMRPENTAHHA